METIWDAGNAIVGYGSAINNASKGNWSDAAWDLGGAIVDTAATAVPFVPGGATTAVKAGRAADKANDARKAKEAAEQAAKEAAERLSKDLDDARDVVRKSKQPNPHKKPGKKSKEDPCKYWCYRLRKTEDILKARMLLGCHPIPNDPFDHPGAITEAENALKKIKEDIEKLGCDCDKVGHGYGK